MGSPVAPSTRWSFHPRAPGTAYAAGDFRVFVGGAGGTWQQVGESPFPIHKLAFPAGPSTTILGASYGGLLQSTDGGAHWNVLSLNGELLTTMLLDPAQPQRLYVGTIGGGILRSDDTGVTWNPVNNGVPYGQIFAFAGDTQDPDVVFASVGQLTPQGGWTGYGDVIRTGDGGMSWTVVTPPSTYSAADPATCAANPEIVYAATHMGLLQSIDGGLTFPQTLLAGKDIASVAVDSTCNTVYAYAFSDAAYVSPDGGKTWSGPLTNGLKLSAPTTVHPISVDPKNANHALAGSQAGLFQTTDNGGTWALVNGVEAVAAGDLSVSTTEPDRLWMGTGGTGVWSRTPGTKMAGAHGRDRALRLHGPRGLSQAKRVFAGTWPGLWASTDDGATFNEVYTPDNIWAVAPDPTNAQILYAGSEQIGVFKSTDGGGHWTQSNGALTAWPTAVGNFIWIGSMLVDPAAPTHVLIGTYGRGIYLSTDSAGTWNPVAPAANMSAVSCLVSTPGPSGAFYACVQGVGVLKSVDGGVTWSTLTSGLASLDVTKLAVNPSSGALYVTTLGDGVFRSLDQGATWKAFDTECLGSTRMGGGIAVLKGSGGNTLVVSGAGGVLAHPL